MSNGVLIRIIATPPGSLAPEHIRDQWVGLILRTVPATESLELEKSFRASESSGGYIVVGNDALDELRKARRTEAAEFWAKRTPDDFFRFKRECCEEI